MVKCGVFEIACVAVAGGTRPDKVIGGRGVASGTILVANGAMVKDGVSKVSRVAVTGGAGASVVIGWWGMTSRTVLVAC